MFGISKKNFLFVVFIVLFGLTTKIYADAAVKRYYNDELKKIRFHLGVGTGVGYDWFMNYDGNNFFFSYPIMLKLFQEITPGNIGLAMAFNQNIESVDMTDKSTYYGRRFYQVFNGMIGIRLMYKSFIPFTEYISPYFLAGFGFVFGNYNSILLIDNKVFDSVLNADGYSISTVLGTEIYIIPSFLAVDLGVKFYYNFDLDIYMSESEDNNVSIYEDITEQMLSFYIGFSYYVF